MKQKLGLAVLLMLATVLLAGCSVQEGESSVSVEGKFTLSFITIGKGDAFLLTTAKGSHYLVDTGKPEDYVQVARLLRIKGVETLDGIFLSHGHQDHAGGLKPLLEAFPTKMLFLSGTDTVSYRELDAKAIAGKYGVPVKTLSCGEELTLEDVQVQCWLPEGPVLENENNNSVIFRLTHGKNSFLLMGDAEAEEEAAFLASGIPTAAKVLKLGHHGESDASSEEFLKQVQPLYALITGNPEENPDSVNPTVAGRLQKLRCKAYYSECEGLALDFCSDGEQVTVETVENPSLPVTATLSILDVDRENQRVTLQNTGANFVNLQGCTLISQRGDEIFRFSAEASLAPGATLTVACRGCAQKDDWIWDADGVWKKKNDAALLYDPNFTLIDQSID